MDENISSIDESVICRCHSRMKKPPPWMNVSLIRGWHPQMKITSKDEDNRLHLKMKMTDYIYRWRWQMKSAAEDDIWHLQMKMTDDSHRQSQYLAATLSCSSSDSEPSSSVSSSWSGWFSCLALIFSTLTRLSLCSFSVCNWKYMA